MQSVLESKLKRLKISCFNENGKLFIGKSKMDYPVLIGLVAFPVIAAIIISVFLILNNFEFIGVNRGKIIAATIALFVTGFFNFSRIMSKKQANDNVKILYNKTIKIKNEFGEYTFDSKNITDFECLIEQIDEQTYQGRLILIDNEERRHQILGFDDENEKYLLNDLKWFAEYLINYVELKTI